MSKDKTIPSTTGLITTEHVTRQQRVRFWRGERLDFIPESPEDERMLQRAIDEIERTRQLSSFRISR